MKKIRKSFEFSREEVAIASRIAESRGISISALGREWIKTFLEKGTELERPETARMQVMVEPEILQEASAKARATLGVSLGEVIRFTISQQQVK